MRFFKAWLATVVSLSFASLALGQAYFGDGLGASLKDSGSVTNHSTCPGYEFRYLGCFTGDLSYAFRPALYTFADPSYNFPGWDPGSNINNTVLPLYCGNVCRGFGFKYAALSGGLVCSCGFAEPSSGLSVDPTTNCNTPCAADITQNCGGTGFTDVYVDPSFASPAEIASAGANLATYYKYLGCYYKPNYPTGESAISFTNQASQSACLTQCASHGYPMAHMSWNSTTSNLNCYCGQSFGKGAFRVLDSDQQASCSALCDG